MTHKRIDKRALQSAVDRERRSNAVRATQTWRETYAALLATGRYYVDDSVPSHDTPKPAEISHVATLRAGRVLARRVCRNTFEPLRPYEASYQDTCAD